MMKHFPITHDPQVACPQGSYSSTQSPRLRYVSYRPHVKFDRLQGAMSANDSNLIIMIDLPAVSPWRNYFAPVLLRATDPVAEWSSLYVDLGSLLPL